MVTIIKRRRERQNEKLVTLVLACFLLTTSALTISAQDDPIEITPRAMACVCGSKMDDITKYGQWKGAGQRRCIHHEYGLDILKERTVTRKYVCPKCGEERLISESTQTRWFCEGYTIPDTGE